MRQELNRLHSGEITFDQFAFQTRSEWQRLGTMLLNKWSAPGVDLDDMVQELLIAAWLGLPKWDGKSSRLDRFIVWNACDKAKKWLHKQRGALRREDKAPNRTPVLLTDPELMDLMATFEPEDRLVVEEDAKEQHYQTLLKLQGLIIDPMDQELLFLALDNEFDLDETATNVYGDPTMRRTYRLGNATSARTRIKKMVARVAAASSAA